ncbi:MAG: excisionase family DNA-binding protein [Chloroflexi bacterium]|nr:excisionase family DNA-binding protein [Chloroflexota bacterium]
MKRSLFDTLSDSIELEDALNAGAVSQFVSVKQAASLLQVSERTIRRLVATNEIPAYYIRSLVRIQWSDIMEYVEAE